MFNLTTKMKLQVVLAASLGLLGSTLFADQHINLSGCYTVKQGSFEVSRGTNSADIVGLYKMILVSNEHGPHKKVITMRGPMKGTPLALTATGALTRHVFGTNNRVGTLTSGDVEPDEFIANSVSCPDVNGVPRLIDATEIMNFSSGTGIYSGLVSGSIEWHGISNSCDDPNNRVADYSLVAGEICFE